jgi:autotransporter-associated beta strand protein
MLVAGAGNGIWQSITATAGSLVPVPTYAAGGGLAPTGIVLDPRSQLRYFVADQTNLFGTTNQGTTFTNLTGNLPGGIIRPTSLEFISNNGVNALLVGSLNNVANAQSPIAAADSNAIGTLTNWRAFGTGLPNTQVSALSYNAAVDVLAVGTFGRGVFTLYDVTSYFPQATVLQFGLANNDSVPDASFLTNGTVGNRPLIKYGTGTLTIAGNATYTGATAVNNGNLIVDGSIASSSGLDVNNGATVGGTGTLPATRINNGGTLSPGNSIGTITVQGNLMFASAATYMVEVSPSSADRTNVTGTASLAGTMQAVFAPGSYTPRSYDILHATGGLGGTTFNGLSSNNPNFAPSLSYTATDVFLNLSASLGAGTPLNQNQQNVANALNNVFNSGGTLPPAFAGLFGLTGGNLANALSQLDGEAATGAERAAFQLTDEFLNLMLDPFVNGRGNVGGLGGGAIGFAPEEQASLPKDVALAYASILNKSPVLQPLSSAGPPGAPASAAATARTAIQPSAPAM